ncbi:response regulator (plasmid) [Bradyrhizobium sp. 195]|nr:response regulator [Bradyrhizobium sp. 195]
MVNIVDDNATFRKAVEAVLTRFGYEVLAYPSAQHLLDRLPNDELPGCILLDVRLPEMSGPELQQQLNALNFALPIIFLTGYEDIPTTVRTIKAGGEDFLTKPVTPEQLLGAIEQAVARHAIMLNARRGLQQIQALLATLTARERRVFELVVRGKLNKQIASELGATERTIKAHRHRVTEKMKVRSLAELVTIAQRLGLLA